MGDTSNFMGGYSNKVYSLSLPALKSQLDSRERSEHPQNNIRDIWTTDTDEMVHSTLHQWGVGGRDKDGAKVSAIRLCQPDTEEWVKETCQHHAVAAHVQ